MMKNKVIEMMAKDWNAYTDAFGKKDDCAYVVVDNSNDSVEKFYNFTISSIFSLFTITYITSSYSIKNVFPSTVVTS